MKTPVNIRMVQNTDKRDYLRMRLALWPDEEHEEELEAFFEQPTWTTFVAERPDGKLCGFLELGQRNYAEGCETSPVAFIEGWYVNPDVQRQGIGRKLVEVAEVWAREHGFTEMGSDALIENETSLKAHTALGYQEIVRVVCFAKKL
jgi:aminoglycoside 6'-N-acetyltransferase I